MMTGPTGGGGSLSSAAGSSRSGCAPGCFLALTRRRRIRWPPRVRLWPPSPSSRPCPRQPTGARGQGLANLPPHPRQPRSSLTSAKKAVKKVEKPGPAFHPSRAASAAGGSPCAPADIVLSLLTSQPSYARGERPSFSVYAVSTAAAACTLTYGAGSVQVVVTRHGHVVWDSAACERSAAAPVRFTLGVPQVVTMVWNPDAAQPAGCAGSLPAGASGTLDAVAMSDGQSSPVRAFKIGGLPTYRTTHDLPATYPRLSRGRRP